MTSPRLEAPWTVTPSTSWASATFSSGTTTCRPPAARPRAPRAGRRGPPAAARRARARRGGRPRGSRPGAHRRRRTATAMGRSKPEPCLGMEAGERFTVTRWAGTGTPEVAAADRTRSGAWPQALSGIPPMANCGSPWVMCASTSTRVPSRPVRVTDRVRPSPRVTTRPRRRAGAAAGGPDGRGCRRRRSARPRAGVVRPHPGRGEPAQPHRLGERHGLDRLAEARGPARLDLADDDPVAVAGDDVDLTVLAAPVALEDGQPLVAQVPDREVLAPPAQAAARVGRADRRGRGARRRARCVVGRCSSCTEPTGRRRPPARLRSCGRRPATTTLWTTPGDRPTTRPRTRPWAARARTSRAPRR